MNEQIFDALINEASDLITDALDKLHDAVDYSNKEEWYDDKERLNQIIYDLYLLRDKLL